MCIHLQDVSCQQCKPYNIMLFLIFLTCHTPKAVGSHYLRQLEVLVWDGSSRNQPLRNTCALNVCESHRHRGFCFANWFIGKMPHPCSTYLFCVVVQLRYRLHVWSTSPNYVIVQLPSTFFSPFLKRGQYSETYKHRTQHLVGIG